MNIGEMLLAFSFGAAWFSIILVLAFAVRTAARTNDWSAFFVLIAGLIVAASAVLGLMLR